MSRTDYKKLTSEDDDQLTNCLWPIVWEMIKTAIENKQNLIVEGWYILFDWQNYFDEKYLEQIKYYCLVISKKYIENNFVNIKKYANKIENRLDDNCSIEDILEDNTHYLQMAKKYGLNYVLINEQYKIEIDLDDYKSKNSAG